MSPLTIAWSMCASACAMLGLLHLLIWFKEHRSGVFLLSATMAFSAAVNSFIELRLQHTNSIDRYIELVKWENLVVSGILVSLVWFIYLYFRTARAWLAITITVLWSLGLMVNFLHPGNLTFREISEIKQISTSWGESFSIAVGTASPWKWVSDIASLLIMIYILDASIRLWRGGNRRRAMVVGGGIIFFITSAGIHSPLVDAGWVETPYMIGFAFLAIVLALSHELVSDVVQVADFKRQVQFSEERWRSFLKNIQLAVLGIDAKGRINYVNPFLVALTGFKPEQLLGQPITTLVPVEEVNMVKARLKLAAEMDLQPHVRRTLVCASGEHRNLAWSSVRILDFKGNYVGIIGIGVDITEWLNSTKLLQKTQHEMERLMRFNMLGELAATLAHELNQPLTAILSNAQAGRRFLNAKPPNPDELPEILDDIVRDDKRAGEIIHRMRAMLESGEIHRELFAINDAARETIKLIENELLMYNVVIHPTYGPNLPQVEGGRIEIQQVILNLVLNAVHVLRRMPLENRRLRIQTTERDGSVVVTVEDNGPGIPVANLPHLFEPFFTTRSTGLGMGLVICRRIIESHGGCIQAENIEEGGARLTFSLPSSKPLQRLGHD